MLESFPYLWIRRSIQFKFNLLLKLTNLQTLSSALRTLTFSLSGFLLFFYVTFAHSDARCVRGPLAHTYANLLLRNSKASADTSFRQADCNCKQIFLMNTYVNCSSLLVRLLILISMLESSVVKGYPFFFDYHYPTPPIPLPPPPPPPP